MTAKLDLDAIEKRAAAATPGSWEGREARVLLRDASTTSYNWQRIAECAVIWSEHQHNASFIAHAREDVPALCARVRELEVLLDSAEHWLSTGGPTTQSDRDCVHALCHDIRAKLGEGSRPAGNPMNRDG